MPQTDRLGTSHSDSSQSMSWIGSSQGPVSCVGPTQGWPVARNGQVWNCQVTEHCWDFLRDTNEKLRCYVLSGSRLILGHTAGPISYEPQVNKSCHKYSCKRHLTLLHFQEYWIKKPKKNSARTRILLLTWCVCVFFPSIGAPSLILPVLHKHQLCWCELQQLFHSFYTKFDSWLVISCYISYSIILINYNYPLVI